MSAEGGARVLSTLAAGGISAQTDVLNSSLVAMTSLAMTSEEGVTLGMTTAVGVVSEKPYEDYTEVKIAVMIDRVYIPVVVAVGVLGNVLCFVTLVFSSLRATSTCVYMAAIAVLDCVILVLDLCVLLRGYMGHAQFYMGSDWACGFHNFLFYFSIHFDVLLLLAMTVDRYVVVRFPLKAQTLCSSRSAVKVIVGVGLFSLALNGQILFTRRLAPTGHPEDPLSCRYPDPEVDFFMKKVYTWIDAAIYSFVPFLSLLVLNVLIIRQLRAARTFSRQFTETGSKKPPGGASGGGNVQLEMGEGDTINSDLYTSNTNLSDSGVTELRDTICEVPNGVADGNQPSKGVSVISRNPAANGKGGGGGSKFGSRSMSSGSSAARKSASSNNITVMLLLVSFTFLLLTSPVVIVLLVKRYYWLPDTNFSRAQARLLHAFVDNLMYTNHAVNFLLYCISGQRFRMEFQRICCRCRH